MIFSFPAAHVKLRVHLSSYSRFIFGFSVVSTSITFLQGYINLLMCMYHSVTAHADLPLTFQDVNISPIFLPNHKDFPGCDNILIHFLTYLKRLSYTYQGGMRWFHTEINDGFLWIKGRRRREKEESAHDIFSLPESPVDVIIINTLLMWKVNLNSFGLVYIACSLMLTLVRYKEGKSLSFLT